MLQGIFRDVTHEKTAAANLAKSFAEKEILVQEIHQRVKTNLQIISSIIQIQAREKGAAQCAECLEDIDARICAMVLVHEGLYKSSDMTHVNISEYLRTLSAQIISSMPSADEFVTAEFSMSDIFMPVDKAIPFGLFY